MVMLMHNMDIISHYFCFVNRFFKIFSEICDIFQNYLL